MKIAFKTTGRYINIQYKTHSSLLAVVINICIRLPMQILSRFWVSMVSGVVVVLIITLMAVEFDNTCQETKSWITFGSPTLTLILPDGPNLCHKLQRG